MFSSIPHFVRELVAAELFFAVRFLILLVFVSVCYLLGAVGERSWIWMKQEARKLSAHLHGALQYTAGVQPEKRKHNVPESASSKSKTITPYKYPKIIGYLVSRPGLEPGSR